MPKWGPEDFTLQLFTIVRVCSLLSRIFPFRIYLSSLRLVLEPCNGLNHLPVACDGLKHLPVACYGLKHLHVACYGLKHPCGVLWP